MNRSKSITNLAAALATAQLGIGPATKGSENETFGNRYADLAATIEACKKPLAENGISVLQLIGGGPLEYAISTMLTHASGEHISEELKFTAPDGIHATTGLVTYWSRYALRGMLNIPAADDDGNSAAGKPDARQLRREIESERIRMDGEIKYVPGATTDLNAPVMLGDSWKAVICHVGGAETKGKPLGELSRKSIQFLANDWTPKKNGIAETNLKNAAKQGLATMPAEAPAPETAPLPLPEDKTGKEGLLNKTEAAAATTPEPPKWREAVVRWMGSKNKLAGKTLGEVADSKSGQFVKALDGAACLRRMAGLAGTTMIRENAELEKQDPDELLAAIKCAVEEAKPFDDAKWLAGLKTEELREEVARRIWALGVSEEDADKNLVASGLEPVATANEETLRTVIAQWETVAKSMKGAQ